MKEILEALKEWILYKLRIEDGYCVRCEAYEQWLDKEIEEKEDLKRVLFRNARLIQEEKAEESDPNLQPIRRHTPLRIRLKQKERESRNKLKQERVEVAQELTDPEQIFQQELDKNKVS